MNGNPPDDSSSDREYAYGRSWQEYLARHGASGEPEDEPAEPEYETPEDEEEAASEGPEEPAEAGPTSGRSEPEPPEPPEPDEEPADTGDGPAEPEHSDEALREPAARRPAEAGEESAPSRVVIPPEEDQFEGASRRRRRLLAGAAAALAVILAALFLPDLLPVGGDSEAAPEAGETPASETGPTGEADDLGGAIAADTGGLQAIGGRDTAATQPARPTPSPQQAPDQQPAPGAGQGAGQPQAAGQIALFSSRAEALADALENFGVRLRDFELNRIGCEGLARGIRQVRASYSDVTDVYESVQSRLDASRVDRYQRLSADVSGAERSFEGTGCPATP